MQSAVVEMPRCLTVCCGRDAMVPGGSCSFASAVRKPKEDRKWSGAIKPPGPPPVTHFLQQGSTPSQQCSSPAGVQVINPEPTEEAFIFKLLCCSIETGNVRKFQGLRGRPGC